MANEILARAKAQYAERAAHCHVDIEEWGDGKKPLRVTWKPLTIADRRRIYAPLDDGERVDGGTISVRTVMWFALDREGKRLFDDMAEHELTYATDSDVIGKISNAILFGVGGEAEPVGKQIEKAKNA